MNTVVKNEVTCKLTEKRSIFISYLKKINSEEEAIEFINHIKSKNHDAKHNVYAYSVNDSKILKYSDDGEPAKTAGAPILDLLTKNELTDVVIVVTRYFGGILLGTGGLVRAYSGCAKLALDEAGIEKREPCIRADISCLYENYEKIRNLIYCCEGKVIDTTFAENVRVSFCIHEDNWDKFISQLNNITLGNNCIENVCNSFFNT